MNAYRLAQTNANALNIRIAKTSDGTFTVTPNQRAIPDYARRLYWQYETDDVYDAVDYALRMDAVMDSIVAAA